MKTGTCLAVAAGCLVCTQLARAESAKQILDATGIQGGLVVHLGCGDGQLAAALRPNDRYLVHGLDGDAAKVQAAREHIKSLDLYGRVSVQQWDEKVLPYNDNLVNLLVSEDPGVPMDEILRVLVPEGIACIKTGDRWVQTVKPRPETLDEWTHYMHDATNNAVANDTAVGPPRRMQWNGGPKWTRSHEKMSSMNALVSTRGRIFYVIDEGPTASIQLPPEWKLVARDAFNGVILWKRDVPTWQVHLWPLKSGPARIPRRLVAVGERVYATLGIDAPVSALEASSGETVRVYEGTTGTEEILLADGILYLKVDEDLEPEVFKPRRERCWDETGRATKVLGNWKAEHRQSVAAIRADTGELQWRKHSRVVPLSLAVDRKSVYFHDGSNVVCLDRREGDRRWETPAAVGERYLRSQTAPSLVVHGGVVLFHTREITALCADTGKELWKKAEHPGAGHMSPGDVLVVNGLVWSGGRNARKFIGKDLRTGEIKVEFAPPAMTWFHPRCHPSKATTRYILASRTGIELADVTARTVDVNHWTRGACVYGIMPSNGLLYVPPHSCACLLETKTSSFNALAPASVGGARVEGPGRRLEKGPAYARTVAGAPAPDGAGGQDPDAWPMYRHDTARSGCTQSAVASELEPLWRARVGGRLTSLVSAQGRVYTARPDTHTVYALDADSGKRLWEFTCGARVDSPPTLHAGCVYFGSHDGYVYCLRASDGQLAWRFLAAPNRRRLVSYGQVESVWPVHGSVLVERGIVHFVAGRSAFLDGGLRFYRLDAESGRMLSVTEIDEKDPRTGQNLQKHQGGWIGLTMPVANTDILSSDGKRIFMRSQPFDLEGRRLRVAPDLEVSKQDREGAHLFSPVGLLDDNWHHRSYWVYGVTGVYGWKVWFDAARYAPSGRLLVFDDSTIYGFARQPQFLAQAPVIEYQLYKADKTPATGGAARVQKTASGYKGEDDKTHWLTRAKTHRAREMSAAAYHWIQTALPLQVRAMVLTKETLFVAGPPDVLDEVELWENFDNKELRQKLAEQSLAWKGQKGGSLWAVSTQDGSKLAAYHLDVPPVFDGMIAAGGRLYVSLMDGSVLCLGKPARQ